MNKKYLVYISVSIMLFCSILYGQSVQQSMIEISTKIRENELELANLQGYMDILELKKVQNEQKLSQYTQNISGNIVSIYKMSTIPLLSLLSVHKTPKDLAISYSVLNYYSNYLKNETANAKEYLDIIAKNEKELKFIENRIKAININMNKNNQTLRNLLKTNATGEIAVLKNANKKLYNESNNLLKIMGALNKNYLLKKEIEENEAFLANKGKFVSPVVGFLESSFQTTTKEDIHYNGISLLSLPNSQIIAPFDGEIVYNEEFTDFGNLIILKHSPSHFSIISGSYQSFVVPTQQVKKHEPIAISINKISPIYYEIQQYNNSVNPENWIEKTKVKKNK